jgi:hypothetical protein
MHTDKRGAPVLSTEEARQGRNAGVVTILVASLILVILAFAGVALVYWQVI